MIHGFCYVSYFPIFISGGYAKYHTITGHYHSEYITNETFETHKPRYPKSKDYKWSYIIFGDKFFEMIGNYGIKRNSQKNTSNSKR